MASEMRHLPNDFVFKVHELTQARQLVNGGYEPHDAVMELLGRELTAEEKAEIVDRLDRKSTSRQTERAFDIPVHEGESR